MQMGCNKLLHYSGAEKKSCKIAKTIANSRIMQRIALVIFLLCGASVATAQKENLPYVLLVSMDGFTNQYIHRYELPNLKKFIKEGAAAEGLIPSFPSKTFPNHYTLVTGLYPGNHGLVDNHFYDPQSESFYTMKNPDAIKNSSFYGGVPLWKLAYQHGIKSASYFWVGSELKKEGEHPDYFLAYEESVPFINRIDQVLDWLKLPEKERPHFISLYFSSPDHESHETGPWSDVTKKKVFEMDSLIGVMMDRIEITKLPVNVILVSDHGMLEMKEEESTFIFLDELVTNIKGKLTVVNGGTQAHIYTTSTRQRDSLYTVLQSRAQNYTVKKRNQFPKQWHYDNVRSGDILLVANPGKYIATGTREKTVSKLNKGGTFGAHGFDPGTVKEMRGIFYAKGPNIKAGKMVGAFQNIHVYPLVAKILKMKTGKIDGKFKVLKRIYKK
jgi:predicted AlkP superfamily pyrophosphatase or phosphodiesterase